MPVTSCGECGRPAYQTERDADAGAEAYCSEACAAGPRRTRTVATPCPVCGRPATRAAADPDPTCSAACDRVLTERCAAHVAALYAAGTWRVDDDDSTPLEPPVVVYGGE